MTDVTEVFEANRSHLFAVAYRMLGSVAEAEDVVQDAYLRWTRADHHGVTEPRAYLTRTVTRLCLDRRGSAAARREQYPGTWLPEPLVDDEPTAMATELSMALMLALERLSPLERAAFLLHDVFDMEFTAIAAALERSEPAVRQLAARARAHVRDARPRFQPSAEETDRIVAAFASALLSGDLGALSSVLAADAVFYADGGGKRLAALNPIYGRDKILRLLESGRRKGQAIDPATAQRAWINGMPGFVIHGPEGVETLALEIVDGTVVAIYSVRNPDKLRHLS
jgi:RNA polymerase sigma-70 factor (ECF subfamily)